MPDREKIIKGLEEAETMLTQAVDRGGDMAVMGAFKCLNNVTDALALLKEQEAVKPFSDDDGAYWCGSCHEDLVWHQKFCSNCGKPVLWEGR